MVGINEARLIVADDRAAVGRRDDGKAGGHGLGNGAGRALACGGEKVDVEASKPALDFGTRDTARELDVTAVFVDGGGTDADGTDHHEAHFLRIKMAGDLPE